MSIQVDARFQLAEPEIILRNTENGKIVKRWTARTIEKWLIQGDITYNELLKQDYHWSELLESTR